MWHQTRTVTLLCETKDKIESVGLAHISFLDSTKLGWEGVKELASGESFLGGGQHTGCSWSSLSWSMRVNYLFIVTMTLWRVGVAGPGVFSAPWQGDTQTLWQGWTNHGAQAPSVSDLSTAWTPSKACEELYIPKVYSSSSKTTCVTGAQNLHPPGWGWWRNQSGSWRRQLQNRGSQLGGGTSEHTIPLLPWKKELEHEHLLKAEWSNVRLQKHRAGSTLLSSLPPSLTEPGGWVTLGHSKNSLGEGGERGRSQAHSSCSSNEGSHRHYVIPTTAIHWESGVGGGGSGIGYS